MLSACQSKNIIAPNNNAESLNYLFISHIRTYTNPSMLTELDNIDFTKFDMRWLGGDLANSTSADNETMDHLDAYFDFADPNTLWALGNHDYTDLALIEEYIERPTFYAYHSDGITFIVLDTQDSLSNIVGEQLELFNHVMDTLEMSSHLVILSHKLFWMYGHPDLEDQINFISNGSLGSCFHCINPNNFYEDLYPRLIEARKGGIEVICLAGDIGFKTNGFSYLSDEGITFLASGVSYLQALNFALLFRHNIEEKILSWEFRLLSEL
jgi:hypothetical protein